MKTHPLLIFILILSLGLASCQRTPAGQSPEPQANAPEAAAPQASEAAAAAPASTPTATVPVAQRVGSFLAIQEIGLGPKGYISLTNFTSVPTGTGGLYLCQAADCFALPEAEVAAGDTARVAVGDGEGLDGVIATNATIGELKPSDGEVALFATDKFDDPKSLLVYLQWGSTPHALTDLAVEAGLWIKTGYAPTSEKATRLYRVEESGWWLFEE